MLDFSKKKRLYGCKIKKGEYLIYFRDDNLKEFGVIQILKDTNLVTNRNFKSKFISGNYRYNGSEAIEELKNNNAIKLGK